MSRRTLRSAWRESLAPLRQEASTNGFVSWSGLCRAVEGLTVGGADVPEHELVEDISFLVQQLHGPQEYGGSLTNGVARDLSAHVSLCRLLVALSTCRTLHLHGPAANLVLGALRRWADTPHGHPPFTASAASAPHSQGVAATPAATGAAGATCGGAGPAPASAPTGEGAPPAAASLQLEALTALAALLPGHLGLLSEHERAAQLAALHSLAAPPAPVQQRSSENPRSRSPDTLESQTLALTVLAACCGRPAATSGGGGGGTALATAASSSGSSLTSDEAADLLGAVASLLQSCSSRSRPVEDSAHSRMYAALLRALLAALAECKQAWVGRAAALVEGLQRFFTYGVQASLAPQVSASASASSTPTQPPAAAAASGSGGGRYRPPHLRRRESQPDDAAGGTQSDSDVSDTEHSGGSVGGGGAVDRFRSSRVRQGVLSCLQAMAKADPRAMQPHWTALLPLHSPLQPRPLTPHLVTMLLYDPTVKVRALAAATIASLVDGPAQRAILAVAEAKSMSSRAPVRGFLTLSLSLGQLLLGAHAGLLHAAGHEASPLVLPGVLRALVALMAATPYERMPPELLPQVLKVLRTRWAALSAGNGPASAAEGELAPIQAAYLACIAECFSTKQVIPGLAAYLQPPPNPNPNPNAQTQTQPATSQAAPSAWDAPHPGNPTTGSGHQLSGSGGSGGPGAGGAGGGSRSGEDCGVEGERVAEQLVRELLALGQNATAPAVLRIEALGALKGLAAHYTFAMPHDVWAELRATSELGLSGAGSPSPRGSGSSSKPPSRNSSSSSLSAATGGGAPSSRPAPYLPNGQRDRQAREGHWGAHAAATSGQGQGGGQQGGSSSSSPEDKAAQLSVKLVSDYLSSIARQYGMARLDLLGPGAADDDGSARPVPTPVLGPAGRSSSGHVSLGPPPSRQQPQRGQQQQHPGGSSPVHVPSEAEWEAGVQRLAGMWQDALVLLVPAATGHVSYMVRSAGLGCLGEIPELVFASLPSQLQHRFITLLCDAAAADAVPAVRAAACKALGTAAAFPAALAQPDLADMVLRRALLGCLRDTVLSVRIAAGWAVANLCDAHRRRLEAPATGAAAAAQGEEQRRQEGEGPGLQYSQQRQLSHTHASTSTSDFTTTTTTTTSVTFMATAATVPSAPRSAASAPGHGRTAAAASGPAEAPPPLLQPHHYRQLALLCGAAITATQDADKVRANGIRAVGNLLSFLAPDMGPGLAAAAAGGGGGRKAGGGGIGVEAVHGSSSQYWRQEGAATANTTTAASGSGGGSFDLGSWLDTALTCLQSSLTTGGMKVQWNACYAALGLLRNPALLAYPRVASRTAPLLLLLVMLVRESGNFKIRTHAAAALAALPTREAYGDVLPDALLVVAGALETLSGGGASAAAATTTAASGNTTMAAPAAGKGAAPTEAEGGEGDGGEGRFPNFRYTAGLTAQLRATLLHLLALAVAPDARRVRDGLARRAEFLHVCLREQMAEAVAPLHALVAVAVTPPGAWGAELLAAGGVPQPEGRQGSGGAAALVPARVASAGLDGWGPLDLPADPFGLSGLGARHGTSPQDTMGTGGLAGLLEGLRVSGGLESPGRANGGSIKGPRAGAWAAAAGRGEAGGSAAGAGRNSTSGVGGGGAAAAAAPGTQSSAVRPPGFGLMLKVPSGEGWDGGGGGDGGEEVQRAIARVRALAASVQGFERLLTQLGPSCEAVQRDVRAALALLEKQGLGRAAG